MSESLDLRKNIPHPVARLSAAAKLLARRVEIHVLRADKPLQVVRIAHPRQDATISALSSAACKSTLTPALAHSGKIVSVSLWLMPSTHGVKIIAVGATRAMLQASCPAPETISRCE